MKSIEKVFEEKNKCCGCSACAVSCPKHCIEMKSDEEGFLYPEIDEHLCVNCGRCRTVCPVLRKDNIDNSPDCYIAFSKDKNIRKHSSSGGAFTELAKKILANGGVVYGAGFNEAHEVVHQAVMEEKNLELLRGSKYVQSRMESTYEEIKKNIDEGIQVYFSGTPCQVAGLYSYLGYRPKKLITQDFICHGVPSPLVWKKYLQTFGNVKKAAFRSKKYGWHYFSMHIDTDKKHYYKRLDEDFYLKLFLDNTSLRPICFNCPIKEAGSSADITLADCWSIDQITDKVTDTDDGLSLIIANTYCGKNYLKEFHKNEELFLTQVDASKALNSQPALRKSVSCNPKRSQFFERLQKESFSNLMNNWYHISLMESLRKKYIFIKTKIRFILKKK